MQQASQDLFREPQELATIKVGGQEFRVYKALLIKDSRYFDRALNGAFSEGQTQTIDFSDDDSITVQDFGLYVDVLFRAHFKDDKKIAHQLDKKADVMELLALWRLADRFLNHQLVTIASKALDLYLLRFSIAAWAREYNNPDVSDDKLHRYVKTLARGFQYCADRSMPHSVSDRFVEAAANMPPQLYKKHFDGLRHSFQAAVTKQFMVRFQDNSLTMRAEASR